MITSFKFQSRIKV